MLYLKDLKLTSITSYSLNDMKYGYDADWANDEFWEDDEYDWSPLSESYEYDNPNYFWTGCYNHDETIFIDEYITQDSCLTLDPTNIFYDGYYPFSFTDETTRKRETISKELRISGKRMLAGLYVSKTTETDSRTGWLFGGSASDLNSDFEMLNASIYASADWDLMKNLTLRALGRIEFNKVNSDISTLDYYGSDAGNFNKEISGVLWGGRIELNRFLDENTGYGASLSKGYKSHGINQSTNIGVNENLSDELREYDKEDAYNAEISFTFEDEKKLLSLNAFYLARVNPQVRLSYQLDSSDPASFDFYTVNANSGYSYGFEGQFKVIVTENLYFYDSFAFLKSHISSYDFLGSSIGDRTQAHAPEFSASAGFEYSLNSGIYMKIDHSLMLDFYHEDQYESKTDPYQVLNTTLGWKKNKINLSLWIKNLFDEKYVTRGYNFSLEPSANNPPYFFSKSYLSYADPRHIGISVSYSF